MPKHETLAKQEKSEKPQELIHIEDILLSPEYQKQLEKNPTLNFDSLKKGDLLCICCEDHKSHEINTHYWEVVESIHPNIRSPNSKSAELVTFKEVFTEDDEANAKPFVVDSSSTGFNGLYEGFSPVRIYDFMQPEQRAEYLGTARSFGVIRTDDKNNETTLLTQTSLEQTERTEKSEKFKYFEKIFTDLEEKVHFKRDGYSHDQIEELRGENEDFWVIFKGYGGATPSDPKERSLVIFDKKTKTSIVISTEINPMFPRRDLYQLSENYQLENPDDQINGWPDYQVIRNYTPDATYDNTLSIATGYGSTKDLDGYHLEKSHDGVRLVGGFGSAKKTDLQATEWEGFTGITNEKGEVIVMAENDDIRAMDKVKRAMSNIDLSQYNYIKYHT